MLEPNALKVTMLFPIFATTARYSQPTYGHGGWIASLLLARTMSFSLAVRGKGSLSTIAV
jgi:hypothetical protein